MRPKNILTFVFSLLVILAISNFSFGQEKKINKKDVPKKVISSFQKSYPKAEIKGTSVEKENGKTYYEIESVEGSQHRDLLYTKDGKVAEIEEALAADNIPELVKNSIMKKYSNGKIHKVEKLTKGNKISYEAVVEHDGKKSEVVLDSKGNIQKMSKENEENEGKESEENEDNDND